MSQALCYVPFIWFSFNIHHEYVRSVALFLLKTRKTLKRMGDLPKGKELVSGKEPCPLGFLFLLLVSCSRLALSSPRCHPRNKEPRCQGCPGKCWQAHLGWAGREEQEPETCVLHPHSPLPLLPGRHLDLTCRRTYTYVHTVSRKAPEARACHLQHEKSRSCSKLPIQCVMGKELPTLKPLTVVNPQLTLIA